LSVVTVPDLGRPVLFGRAELQARLTALLDQARAGSGGAALLVGEPGIGKTALLRATAAAAGEFLVLWTQGAEDEAAIPLAGLHGMLRPVTELLAALPALPVAQAAALAPVLEPGGQLPAARLPLAAATLRLVSQLARSRPVLCCVDDVQWLDAASRHALAFAARRLAGEPVVMLFAARTGETGGTGEAGGAAGAGEAGEAGGADGAGGAEEAYREVLAGVPELPVGRLDPAAARAALAVAIGALTVGGPAGGGPAGDATAGGPGGGGLVSNAPAGSALASSGLASSGPAGGLAGSGLAGGLAGSGLAGGLAGSGPAGGGLAGGVAEAVVRLAAGNPLALVELLGSLTGDQRAGRAALPEMLPAGSGLVRAYLARVRRLPGATRTLLVLAAAADEMSVDTLLLAAAAAGVDLAALEPAQRAGLLDIDDATVHFGHPLVRAAVYHSAPLAHRRAAHQVLAGVYGRLAQPGRAAWHRGASAEPPDPALADDLAGSAVEVRGRGGYGESSVAFERAAQLSPPGPARAGRLIAAARDGWLAGQPHRARVLLHAAERAATSPDLRGRVDLLRGDIELRNGDIPAAHSALLSAARQLLPSDRALAVQAVLRAGQAAALAGDHAGYLQTARLAAEIRQPGDRPDVQLVLDYLAGTAAMIRGELADAQVALRRAVDLAGSCTDTAALIWASIAALILGDARAARSSATRAVATARARAAVSSIPQALEALVYTELAAGRYLSARPCALEGLRLAEETGQDNCASHHLAALALLDAITGDEQTCLDRASAAAGRAAARGLGLAAAYAAWAEAMLHLAHGRAAEAAARFRASASAGVGRTHFAVRLLTTPHFVEAAACSGDRGRARAAADGYARWARATGDAGWLGLAARCEALLADGPAAAEHYLEALRLHGVAAAEFERARTGLLFGTALRRQRRPALAREHLYEALDTFRRFGAQQWAARAQAELRAAGEAVTTATHTTADQLTAQQLRIARCVAHGATNREVAAQLFLSPRTVDHHLRNIYTKLGIRSRVELVRLLG
jgi:DNA-binding CsgD family transcriptional regulator